LGKTGTIDFELKRNLLFIFTLLAIVAMSAHLLFCIVYSFRQHMPRALVAKADGYCVPLFHQNWQLFAPDLPEYNSNLQYRIATSVGWSDWADATANFGYGITSRMETIEQGFNVALDWQVMDNLYSKAGKAQFDRIVQSNAYASALFYVLKMEEIHHPEIRPDSVQLRMEYRFTPPPNGAHTFQKSWLEFPVYAPQR
jgi:hypothetical protein